LAAAGIRHLKTNAGTALNKALENADVDALQDVLQGINFNKKIGQRTLDDDTLANFIVSLDKIDTLGQLLSQIREYCWQKWKAPNQSKSNFTVPLKAPWSRIFGPRRWWTPAGRFRASRYAITA